MSTALARDVPVAQSLGSSPVLAMLWEQWRVTRTEAAWRLGLGTVGAAAVSALIVAVFPDGGHVNDFAGLAALFFIVGPNLMGWVSLQKLTGGRPGFPFPLRYTHPVRTSVLVGVPMAYVTAVSAAIYGVSASLLTVFGYPFPLAAGAAWIGSFNVVFAAANWWTRNPIVRLLGVMAVSATWTVSVADGLNNPKGFDLPLAFYAATCVMGLVAFSLTVKGVARQRRGGGGARTSWSFAEFRDRLTSWIPFPCPTSSAMRAQLWFEMRRRGLLLLTVAVALAIVNPLLYAVGIPVDATIAGGRYLTCRVDGCFYGRAFALIFAALSVPGLLILGLNAFGIRANQGRLHLSAFDATQPCRTGRLAAIKVFTMLVSVCTALAIVVGSAWASGLFSAAANVFLGDPRIWPRPPQFEAIGALSGDLRLALIIVAFIGIALVLASDAALTAIKTRYPGRIGRAVSLLLLYGLTLAGLALAERGGLVTEIPFAAILRATSWVAAGAMALATVCLFWRDVAERLLTPWQACGLALAAGAIGVAWVAMLREVGTVLGGGIATVLLDINVPLDAVPAIGMTWMLWPVLMVLMVSVLAPWSLSRIRHV